MPAEWNGAGVTGLLEGVGSLAGPSAYLVIAMFAALESSAFVGLFVPGEVALLLGGYIAFQGHASLIPMMAAATAGAVVGDSVGYEIGRHLGGSLRRSKLGQKVGEERWARAEQYLATRGGRAVFFGRFVGVLRALVPALAGVSRIRYRRFLLWNALGAVIWGPSLVGLGYVAGRSYRRVEHYAGRAGLVLLALGVMIGAIAAVGRWVSRHPERVRAFGRRIGERPFVLRFRSRYRAQLEFVVRRLKPGQALGLALTLQLVALGLAGWAFGAVVRDVVKGTGTVRFDTEVSRLLLTRRVSWLTTTMHGVTQFGGALVLTAAIVGVGLVARRSTRSWAPLIVLGAALLGAVAIGDAVKPLVGRVRPATAAALGVKGYAFPSGHATQSMAVYGGFAYLAAGWLRPWAAKVAAWTVALVVVLVIGFSRVYLGLHWVTDVLGGYALGAVWLAAVLVTTSAVQGARRRRRVTAAAASQPVRRVLPG